MPNLAPLSSHDRDQLSADAQAFAQGALAAATRRAYAAQWRAWLAYATANDLSALPAAPVQVANWLAGRALHGARGGRRAAGAAAGQALSTLRVAVAAVRHMHAQHGLRFDSRNPALCLVLRGIGRADAGPVQAPPLTSDALTDLLAGLGERARDRRDAALLAVGYCFGRRAGELARLDWRTLGAGDGVLAVDATHMTLRLIRSKTARPGEDEMYVVPLAGNGAAVDALQRWLTIAPTAAGAPLFRRVYRSGRTGRGHLTAPALSTIIKRCLCAFFLAEGLDPGLARQQARTFSAHSLRVGFAVSAAEAGSPDGSIQAALGHRTGGMAAHYSRAARRARTSPHHRPGVGLARQL